MDSFACGVLLVCVVCFNILNADVHGSISSETKRNRSISRQEMKNQVILQYQSLLEKRAKINRDIKNVEDFWKKRTKLADSEVRKLFGNDLRLNENELVANEIILSKKFKEYNQALDSSGIFPPSIPFPQAKPLIEESDIFEIIKKIPKGANIYSSFLTSIDFEFMYELTFDDNLYFRFDDKLYLIYSKTRPHPGWRSLSYLRNTTDHPEYIEDLNNAIKESLSMIIANPSQEKLYNVVYVHLSIIKYKPNFMKALRRILEILYEDNIMYTELNFQFLELYDLDGKVYNPISVLRLSKVVVDDFIRTHKDFIGLRFIYTSDHPLNTQNINEFRKTAIGLWKANPNLIAGYGITSGKEPLSGLVEELLKFPKEMKCFLVTSFYNNWGVNSDYNILDSLILSVASIGEGYTIHKHPFVVEELRKQDIPIKLCPIFSQTLNIVKDLRDHPLSSLVAINYPLVVGNVGGSFGNVTGLSYDWYEFYMAMTPRFCDIRCLKQLAVNSWLYSSLPAEEKKRGIAAWEDKWNEFIDDLIFSIDPRN